jgi:hypothetical protein
MQQFSAVYSRLYSDQETWSPPPSSSSLCDLEPVAMVSPPLRLSLPRADRTHTCIHALEQGTIPHAIYRIAPIAAAKATEG